LVEKPGFFGLVENGARCEIAKFLLKEATQRSSPQQICSSFQTKNWIRPLLLQQYSLQREYDQFVMVCNQIPLSGVGRWSVSQDKPMVESMRGIIPCTSLLNLGVRLSPHPASDILKELPFCPCGYSRGRTHV
jgi:hypothetical protein